jgi:hypothetical protein
VIGLYAMVSGPLDGAVGASGEPLREVRCGELRLLVGAAPPALSPESLRAHEAAVRGIADACDACLPARFGSGAADDDELRARVEPRALELLEALALVRGREQMTLRVQEAALAVPLEPLPPGPGARYLEERRRARRLPELDPLRAAVAALVRAERIERQGARGLLASIYHLIDKGTADAYRAAVAKVDGLRVVTSGPWPAWSFAPEVAAP